MSAISPTAAMPATRTAPRAADWRAAVAPHIGPVTSRSIFQLVSTLLLLALTLTVMYRSLGAMPWLSVLLLLPAAGLLVRTFIFMHDCTHGSFLPWRRGNDLVGFVTGVLTFTPYGQWRRDHALHHASSGDLDRRGHGDVPTLTVREYLARSKKSRLVYRLVRHPFTLLTFGPLHLIFGQRFRPRSKATGTPQIASVWATNAAIVLGAAVLVYFLGWTALLMYTLSFYIAGVVGIWLFYVQHQFEDAYWQQHESWDYAAAALHGSSHLKLPKLLQWFTGSIGLHHVHHLAPKIPNYRLQECHDSNELLQVAPVITMRSGNAALRLALWDEETGRLVRFADIRDRERATALA